MIFPSVVRSASMPKIPCTEPYCRRNPVITSSTISSAPFLLQIPCNPFKKPVSGGTTPMFAAIGSTMIAAIMGVVPPETGFLKGLQGICKRNGALLIVDEVITGFRLQYGSVQGIFGIDADLTTLGKIIGGGVPVAAYGGRAELMDQVAPLGPVYQAGTLAGNPLAMRAGIAALQQLTEPGLYEEMAQMAQRLVLGLRAELADAGIPGEINAIGSLATVFFASEPVRNYKDAKRSDTKRYARFFREMLDQGIFLAPSQFEAAFISAAHTPQDIDRTLAAGHEALQVISSDSAG